MNWVIVGGGYENEAQGKKQWCCLILIFQRSDYRVIICNLWNLRPLTYLPGLFLSGNP